MIFYSFVHREQNMGSKRWDKVFDNFNIFDYNLYPLTYTN